MIDEQKFYKRFDSLLKITSGIPYVSKDYYNGVLKGMNMVFNLVKKLEEENIYESKEDVGDSKAAD